MQINAIFVDIPHRALVPSSVTVRDGIIAGINPLDQSIATSDLPTMIPGFIDAHVHIESSMMLPSAFAQLAVRHGTVATVSDPHEIANVLGSEGVRYMIKEANSVPLKFFFGVPSCVPATEFETAGARIDADEVEQLLREDELWFLAEMMDFPGVLNRDPKVAKKIGAAKKLGKRVDGHAPALQRDEAAVYARAGITSDHECTNLAEAEHKISVGMSIQIREGSAAKNFDALFPLIDRYPDQVMFCSDDKHPDALADGHINDLVRRAIERGADPFHVLQAACLNPIRHYGLPVGQLRVGDPADFVLVEDLQSFRIIETTIDGYRVFDKAGVRFRRQDATAPNRFDCRPKKVTDFQLSSPSMITPDTDRVAVRVIEATDGSLVTGRAIGSVPTNENLLLADAGSDTLQLSVVNRYHDAPVANAYVRGFGMRQGAIGSSVAHDSHNIVAVGCDASSLAEVVNAIISQRGGIAASFDNRVETFPLPVAGIMSAEDGPVVANEYRRLDQLAKSELGSTLMAPFMTLSFMALLVIPELKLSDQGLFDALEFRFVDPVLDGSAPQ